MQRLRRHSQRVQRNDRGASILYALLLMIVCMMVCVVILDAATTAVKRVEGDYATTQCDLIMDSAAQFVQDEFAGSSVQVTVASDGSLSLPEVEQKDDKGNVKKDSKGNVLYETVEDCSGQMGNFLMQGVVDGFDDSYSFTITTSDSKYSELDGAEVTGTFTLQNVPVDIDGTSFRYVDGTLQMTADGVLHTIYLRAFVACPAAGSTGYAQCGSVTIKETPFAAVKAS